MSAAAAIVVSMIVEFLVSVSFLSTKFFKIMMVTNMMLNAIQALIMPAIFVGFQIVFSIQQFLKKNCLKVLCFQIFQLFFRLSLVLVKVVQLIPVVLIRSLLYTY